MLHRPLGRASGPEAGDVVLLTPADAGWDRAGLRVIRLAPGVPRTVRTGDAEAFVLPLSGSLRVRVRPTIGAGSTIGGDSMVGAGSTIGAGPVEATYDLAGRESVFTRVTDFCYVGRDSDLTLTSEDGAEVALPSARCDRRLAPAYGPAEQVPVEVRGAGSASRQVTNFGVPGVWEHAEKLICCELITPDGNWSSYPPHKHDASDGCPVVNEEIYFYRIAGPDRITPSRDGFGLHRTYTGPEHAAAGLAGLDLLVEVRDLDVVLVPHGFHGPCVAAPGYPMYYLNVMAGPAPERALAFCDDPAHGWVRDRWPDLPVDPRVPFTSSDPPPPRSQR